VDIKERVRKSSKKDVGHDVDDNGEFREGEKQRERT